MPATLPVPIQFQLPEGWRPVPPDKLGAPDTAFAALHPQPDDGFSANITIEGEFRPDTTPLSGIADESVERMRGVTESLVVAARLDAGSPEAPGLTQRLNFSAVVGGVSRDLVQSQVYLAMLDTTDPGRRAVYRLALTATAEQHDSVLEDFQDFVRTVRPDTGTGS